MEPQNTESYYSGIKCYGSNDLGNWTELERAEPLLAKFDPNKAYENINDVIELYNIRNLLELGISLKSWTPEQREHYVNVAQAFVPIIQDFFLQINDQNFNSNIQSVCSLYLDDFWTLFSHFKAFNRISPTTFSDYLSESSPNLSIILKQNPLVQYYGQQLAEFMRMSSQTPFILVNRFLKAPKAATFIPKELKPSEFENIFLRHIESENLHPNICLLISQAQNTKECPISDNLRLKAKKAYDRFWHEQAKTEGMLHFSLSVCFTEQEERKKVLTPDNMTFCFLYSRSWLESTLTPPAILRNFIYLFEIFDHCLRSNIASSQLKSNPLEDFFTPKGERCYNAKQAFVFSFLCARLNIKAYTNFLKAHGIELENVFKWFFESHLPEAFKVNGFSMAIPAPEASYVEKARCLAGEMDAILKQFRMFVRDGKIDRELFEISSEHIIIENIPSLIPQKYAYPNSEEINREMTLLFSTQTTLRHTKEIKTQYSTFFELVAHERLSLSDFYPMQHPHIQWLIKRGCLVISEENVLTLEIPKVILLKDLNDNGVLCLHHLQRVPVLEQMLSSSDLRVTSMLFSEPESDYLNYLLNKSKFSDGLDLRNKYMHGTYPKDPQAQEIDYTVLQNAMLHVVIKMMDEFLATQ